MAPPQTQKDATKAVHKPDYDAVRKVSPSCSPFTRQATAMSLVEHVQSRV